MGIPQGERYAIIILLVIVVSILVGDPVITGGIALLALILRERHKAKKINLGPQSPPIMPPPPPPKAPAIPVATVAAKNVEDNRIALANKHAINQLYKVHLNSSTNKASDFAQRIGSRDREAIRTQIRGRRNNVYEPIFRQELEEAPLAHKWWDNDEIMVQRMTDKQRQTVQTGRVIRGGAM